MNPTPFTMTQIAPDLWIFQGAVNVGILIHQEKAILIDCDDQLMSSNLQKTGITSIEAVYCTQHRRPNTAGIYQHQQVGLKVFVPAQEKDVFTNARTYWTNWANRWHLYHARPGPLAPLEDISVSGIVQEGDFFSWGRFSIRVIDTPGMSNGSVSYIVESNGHPAIIFSGDILYGPGQIWDIHSLQKNMGGIRDYHGFLGGKRDLCSSLEKIKMEIRKLTGPDEVILIPSHGEPISNPDSAIQLTTDRLEDLYRNYASISALNFYFPEIFRDLANDPQRMSPANPIDFPEFLRPVAATSYALFSNSGAILLIDCGSEAVVKVLNLWKSEKIIDQIEGCWVTHYHDDHVDALHHLVAAFPDTPILADRNVAEIISNPQHWMLPCISPVHTPVHRVTGQGESWKWHEFHLTVLHFPGQSLYHGGLIVRGYGQVIFFCGDSFAPTGLDDYTAGNRNFLGEGKGYRLCLRYLREYMPDLIINQHQKKGFHFDDDQIQWLEDNLIEREKILSRLLPWKNPNFGTDENWVRVYPYEIDVLPGSSFRLAVQFTNHADEPARARVEPILPEGWHWNRENSTADIQVPANTSGTTFPGQNSADRQATVELSVPNTAVPGLFLIAFRLTWEDTYLGQFRHAMVRVI